MTSASDALAASGGAGLLDAWTLSLADADLPRQLGFLFGGWGWLAALATISLGAFARRGGAPRKPGIRLALIAAACTLPTVVLLIGGEKRGITRSFLEQADVLLQIPYGRPFGHSLGAAASAAVISFEIMRQRLSAG